MWIYSQSTGKIQSGGVIACGYSGCGDGKNNPKAQTTRNVGPIPIGRYGIGPAITDPHKGPLCMRLTPDPANEMFGRSGFMIHGDSTSHPGTASEGCIILDRTTRLKIAASKSRDLEVTA